MSYDYKDARDYAPEEMKPNGTEVLLVGITRHGEFHYYVLPRHLLYLDGRKSVIHGNDSAFYDGIPGRYNIMVVNESYEDAFFKAIEPHKRSLGRLRDEVHMCETKYGRAGYFIEVLINFDCKHMTSYYGEPYYFEEDVPDGWTSERVAYGCSEDYYFMDDGPDGNPERNIGIGGLEQDYIPLDKRFWIDKNGKSIFRLLYEEGLRSGRDKPPVPFPSNRVVPYQDWIEQNTVQCTPDPPVDLDWIPEDVEFWTENNERNLFMLLYNMELRCGGRQLFEARRYGIIPEKENEE